MKSLSRDQMTSLLAVARLHSEADYLMLLVTVLHGLRVSETLSLTRDNIVDGYIVVQRLKGSRKTIQPLLPAERDALLHLASKTEGRFFTMCRKTFWLRMKAYAAEAGVPEFLAHPHALKHTAGRLGYLGGMGVAELQTYLGHKSGSSTMVYMQAGEQEAASAFGAAFGAAFGGIR